MINYDKTKRGLFYETPCILLLFFVADVFMSLCSSYQPGDVLMVEPHNMTDTVASFIDLLHLSPDAIVTLNTSSFDSAG